MRHLPNLLTLANLFCGCIAIAYVLNAQPFLYHNMQGGAAFEWNWAQGVTQLQWGAVFIIIAAVFDLLDGFAARALKVFSPIGKDLDSLADLVSFGVAPAAILYQMLWDATMWHNIHREVTATDVDLVLVAPAFLIACFAALRLARFNNLPSDTANTGSFRGMPTPAVGLFVASLALANWDAPGGITAFFQNRWALYGLIALLCWLMVAPLKFMKLLPPANTVAQWWPRAALILGGAVAFFLFGYGAGPVILGLYILLSFFVPAAPAPLKSSDISL